MSSRQNIHPYLSDKTFKRFKKYCKASNATESSVAEEAIQRFLDDRYDVSLLLRRLDRQGRAMGRFNRDLGFLGQAFSVFVQIWFAHTPTIGADEKGAANAMAQKRYSDFLDYVARSLSSGDNFFDLLPNDVVADSEELLSLAAQSGGDDG